MPMYFHVLTVSVETRSKKMLLSFHGGKDLMEEVRLVIPDMTGIKSIEILEYSFCSVPGLVMKR